MVYNYYINVNCQSCRSVVESRTIVFDVDDSFVVLASAEQEKEIERDRTIFWACPIA